MKNQELWSELLNFSIDDYNSSFTFTQRLARENGWSIDYATRVVHEYKKFIYMAMISSISLTPSDEVDQAWHLHMLYTESYWDELCAKVLGREIGHGPTKGGSSERIKYNDQYNNTLDLYKVEFGNDAPKDIWPDAKNRFSNINYQRVNMGENIVLNKSKIRQYMAVYTIAPFLLFISFLLMSANSEEIDIRKTILLVAIILLGIFLIRGLLRYLNKKNRGGSSSSSNNNYNSGCSVFGSFFGCSTDSDSGCGSSGCSGCGGCGD